MTILGAIARPQLPPERILELATIAEDAGLDELWLWEDSFWEGGIAMTAAVLGRTERLRVGIGVLPFPLRNAALCAMELATLDRGFPGRFIAGLGHGVQEWMGQAGVRASSFLTLEREYVAALRALLAGDEVTVAGEYVRLDRIRLEWPPATTTPLHLAATGPKSLVVAGEVGDGVILEASNTVDDLPRVLGLIAEGRAASGRDGAAELTVFVEHPVRDAGAVVALVRAWSDAGADRVVLQTTEDDPDPAGFLRFVAEDVADALA